MRGQEGRRFMRKAKQATGWRSPAGPSLALVCLPCYWPRAVPGRRRYENQLRSSAFDLCAGPMPLAPALAWAFLAPGALPESWSLAPLRSLTLGRSLASNRWAGAIGLDGTRYPWFAAGASADGRGAAGGPDACEFNRRRGSKISCSLKAWLRVNQTVRRMAEDVFDGPKVTASSSDVNAKTIIS